MFYMQKFLFLLLTLVLLGPLGIDLYLPSIPAIAKGLNSAEAIIQSSISLFILVMGLGHHQAKVITHGTGVGVAVLTQIAAGRQLGEHRSFNRRNAV